MKVQLADVGSIRPYDRNPRKNGNAVTKVAASIEEFGFRQPIVVDSEMTIIAGHTRWEAAKILGLKKVPVSIAKDLTPDQVKAYRIADNKVAEHSEWDNDLLAVELGELRESSFDLEILGFDPDDLDRALSGEAAAFEPNLSPSADGGEVTDAQVSRTAENLRNQFASAQADSLVTVMCPHCAQEFAIDKGAL